MIYEYQVVESESKFYTKGLKFDSYEKLHDGRKKVTDLADKDCKEFQIKLREKKE